MPAGSRITDAPINDAWGEQLTVPGNAGTKTVFGLRHGFNEILIECAAASRIHLPPAIIQLVHYDASASAGSRWVSLLGTQGQGFSSLINRNVTGGTGTQLDSMATADYIYIGTTGRHGGIFVDMTASVNATVSSVMTAAYSATASFTADAITDGTVTSGRTLAKDGNITIDTVPSESLWVPRTLLELGETAAVDLPGDRLYWWRLDVSVAMPADVEIQEILPFHRAHADVATESGGSIYLKATTEYTIDIDRNKVGGLEIGAQGAGATTANVSWLEH